MILAHSTAPDSLSAVPELQHKLLEDFILGSHATIPSSAEAKMSHRVKEVGMLSICFLDGALQSVAVVQHRVMNFFLVTRSLSIECCSMLIYKFRCRIGDKAAGLPTMFFNQSGIDSFNRAFVDEQLVVESLPRVVRRSRRAVKISNVAPRTSRVHSTAAMSNLSSPSTRNGKRN